MSPIFGSLANVVVTATTTSANVFLSTMLNARHQACPPNLNLANVVVTVTTTLANVVVTVTTTSV